MVSDSESKTILDHIAVVVEDLDQGEAFYQSLGLEFDQEREVVPSQGVATSFAPKSYSRLWPMRGRFMILLRSEVREFITSLSKYLIFMPSVRS